MHGGREKEITVFFKRSRPSLNVLTLVSSLSQVDRLLIKQAKMQTYLIHRRDWTIAVADNQNQMVRDFS
jgi:hypothetical protein